MDDLPFEVPPGGGQPQCAAHRDGHGLGAEAEQHGIWRQGSADGGSKLCRVSRDGLAFQRLSDVVQRAVGFQEKVACHLHVGQSAIVFLQVHHHQLAAGDLVLTVPRAHRTLLRNEGL
ncbi:hypothetical protein V8H18_12670 [Lautropia mirabilis]